ncbi:MAG: SHOCT domain-containing protein [Thermoleophilia bacterium]|nr:SHOCT domain-containing protein [Thermoleophilia bacterium]
MESQTDAKRAMRELIDEVQKVAEQAGKLARQAAVDMGQLWRPGSAKPAQSPADTIRELAKLRDEGHITEDEFQTKKRELLERI